MYIKGGRGRGFAYRRAFGGELTTGVRSPPVEQTGGARGFGHGNEVREKLGSKMGRRKCCYM